MAASTATTTATNRASSTRATGLAGDAGNNRRRRSRTTTGATRDRATSWASSTGACRSAPGNDVPLRLRRLQPARGATARGFFRRAIEDRNLPQIYPLGFLPLIEPEVIDVSVTFGLRGARGDWFWDASAEYGDNSSSSRSATA